ncbi:MAG: tRNA threonylcarbamoyladenosine dehydratase [Clostridia bacterium]|nr:tRNA threonylcarbamoyladenosine dehydratase [Clostridia bacterium]
MKRYERERMLIGDEAMAKLKEAKVMLFGVGGVGSYAAEALGRAGVGNIVLVDNDTVSVTNINRQLCALESTVGKLKTEVTAERLKDIDSSINVECVSMFVLPENIDELDMNGCSFIIDAIDTVSAKIAIAVKAAELGIPMISSMGTGNKLDPSALKISDLSKTSGCPLARVMRRELKKRGITHLPVVYSEEMPISPIIKSIDGEESKKIPPGSISFVPSVAGLLAASAAIKNIIK